MTVYKEAIDNEDHHDKLISNEISKISQDIAKFKKESNDINERSEYIQGSLLPYFYSFSQL